MNLRLRFQGICKGTKIRRSTVCDRIQTRWRYQPQCPCQQVERAQRSDRLWRQLDAGASRKRTGAGGTLAPFRWLRAKEPPFRTGLVSMGQRRTLIVKGQGGYVNRVLRNPTTKKRCAGRLI